LKFEKNLLKLVLPSIHFIENQITKGKGVLVTCDTNITVAPALMIGYLIKQKGMTFSSALAHIKGLGAIVMIPPEIQWQL
jgi:hypothetical protein